MSSDTHIFIFLIVCKTTGRVTGASDTIGGARSMRRMAPVEGRKNYVALDRIEPIVVSLARLRPESGRRRQFRGEMLTTKAMAERDAAR